MEFQNHINEKLPIQEFNHPLALEHDIDLKVLRLDATHPEISGNKWFKLKYNLHEAKQLGFHKLLTYGGAFSNHIYAVASASKLFGFETIGVIRGEPHDDLNPTLRHATNCGMRLHYMDRETYRRKTEPEVLENLKSLFGEFYIIPEGGTNQLALKGAREITSHFTESFDYYCLPVGTGGTIAGIILGLKNQGQVIGFSALKGDFLKGEVQQLLKNGGLENTLNWNLNTDYHFGGYAKTKVELLDFIREMETKYDLPLEPIYTGKMVYGVLDLIKQSYFLKGSKILMIHTGGLQGRAGFNL